MQGTQDALFQAITNNIEISMPGAIASIISDGGEVNIRDSEGYTPLQRAAQKGQPETLAALLLAHANVNDQGGTNQQTALHLAIAQMILLHDVEKIKAYIQVIKILLANGADPNIPDIERNISVHPAAQAGNLRVLKLLTFYGAQLNAVTLRHTPALYLAVVNNQIPAALFFDQIGISFDDKNELGDRILHAALKNRRALSPQMIEAYIERAPNTIDLLGQDNTPLLDIALNAYAPDTPEGRVILHTLIKQGGRISTLTIERHGLQLQSDLYAGVLADRLYRQDSSISDPLTFLRPENLNKELMLERFYHRLVSDGIPGRFFSLNFIAYLSALNTSIGEELKNEVLSCIKIAAYVRAISNCQPLPALEALGINSRLSDAEKNHVSDKLKQKFEYGLLNRISILELREYLSGKPELKALVDAAINKVSSFESQEGGLGGEEGLDVVYRNLDKNAQFFIASYMSLVGIPESTSSQFISAINEELEEETVDTQPSTAATPNPYRFLLRVTGSPLGAFFALVQHHQPPHFTSMNRDQHERLMKMLAFLLHIDFKLLPNAVCKNIIRWGISLTHTLKLIPLEASAEADTDRTPPSIGAAGTMDSPPTAHAFRIQNDTGGELEILTVHGL